MHKEHGTVTHRLLRQPEQTPWVKGLFRDVGSVKKQGQRSTLAAFYIPGVAKGGLLFKARFCLKVKVSSVAMISVFSITA